MIVSWPGKTFPRSPAAVLDAKPAPGISPIDRPVDTGDHAGAALQTTGKLDDHLPFLCEGIEIGRTGIDTESLLARLTGLLVESDVGLLVIFDGIQGQLLGDLHWTPHRKKYQMSKFKYQMNVKFSKIDLNVDI
jgi:hypothetical protein